jgi:hypothetical protein
MHIRLRNLDYWYMFQTYSWVNEPPAFKIILVLVNNSTITGLHFSLGLVSSSDYDLEANRLYSLPMKYPPKNPSRKAKTPPIAIPCIL